MTPQAAAPRFLHALRAGSFGQRALATALVAIAVLGCLISIADKAQRLGQPNVGWALDNGYVSPTRDDASDAGLRGGGRALELNGETLAHNAHGREQPKSVRTGVGEINTLTLRHSTGTVRQVTLTVRPWTWHDIIFTEGATDGLGLLFFAVGIATFVLRPFDAASWALLVLSSVAGGLFVTLFTDHEGSLVGLYFMQLVGVICYVPLHAALVFPVVHPLLARRPGILWLIYGFGVAQGSLYLAAHVTNWTGPFAYARTLGTATLLLSTLVFIGRCLVLALHTKDHLAAQRARILLAGALLGLAPFALVQFMQETFGALAVDNRFLYWSVSLFLFAIVRVTLRQELLNARIAVRRAVLYTTAVVVLTVLAALLVSVRPYAVAALLLPLLYLWPRFEARLNERLYPKRARFPELLREIGDDLAACTTAGEILTVLAEAPARLCDARDSVAFLFPGVLGADEQMRRSDGRNPRDLRDLANEPVVRLMAATRREISRDHVAVEPQYANIKDEGLAGFDRLGAELLLPLRRGQEVVGGLAVGPRVTGDVFEAAEIGALTTVTQQAVQAIIRIEAIEKLRAREREFGDLKRFFPPQIIDQVMARGGVAELRSQRKLVTVFFADLRGFTAFSERVEPEEVMATLAEYHDAMGRRIAACGGTLERFAGDGFMVFFNDPVEQPDHAERAARMALGMQADAQRLHEGWARRGYDIDLGMGLDTGYATCGFIGYEGRRDYAVIGNVTNLAARLSDAAGRGEILISARARAELPEGFLVEPVGDLALKGFQQPQPAYRLRAAPPP